MSINKLNELKAVCKLSPWHQEVEQCLSLSPYYREMAPADRLKLIETITRKEIK